MLKSLVKKQFLSFFANMGGNRKNKNKSLKTYIILTAIIAIYLGIMFFNFFALAAPTMVENGYGWMFFCYVWIAATLISVMGNVFTAQSQLYDAKDNDLLLSMPIPPRYILFSRMISLYAQNFLFTAPALISAYIAYGLAAKVTFSHIITWIITIFVQPLLPLFICCLLGLVLSLIMSKLNNKSLVTMIVSLAFLVVYFILYFYVMNNMEDLLNNSDKIANNIKVFAYPIYIFGKACDGSIAFFFINLSIIAVLFGLLYFVLSKTYIKLITSSTETQRVKKTNDKIKSRSPLVSLISKEAKRFFGNGTYMLNGGLGIILLPVATILMLINKNSLLSVFEPMGISFDIMPLLACITMSFISSFNMVSAPSISLEGKSFYILKSAPVDMEKVLLAKLIFHYLVTAPIATVCMIIYSVFLKPSVGMIILMIILPSVVVTFSGVLGLVFNLKKPNLNWDNEAFVIKQSMSIVLTMVTNFGGLILLTIPYFFLSKFILAEIYLLIAILLICAAIFLCLYWLKKKGTEIMQKL